LQPHWGSVTEFLDHCEEFKGNKDSFDVSSSDLLKPLAIFFRPPSPSMVEFQVAVEALNGYETLKEGGAQSLQDGSSLTCLPMSPESNPVHRHPGIAVFTVATQNNKNLFGEEYDPQARTQYDRAYTMSLSEKQKYCDRHGYDFHVVTDVVDGRNSGWYRIPALALMGSYDWVFYVDLDTVTEPFRGTGGVY
jgi:hypothetical protein